MRSADSQNSCSQTSGDATHAHAPIGLGQTAGPARRSNGVAGTPDRTAEADQPRDVASGILALFEANIANGVWAPGSKVPSERELETQLGVPRARLRKYLVKLVDEGKIVRQVGRGSFIADARFNITRTAAPLGLTTEAGRDPRGMPFLPGHIAALADLVENTSPNDIMEIRMMVEPIAAKLAARRATAAELAQIRECSDISSKALGAKSFDHWENRLHFEIIKTAKNDFLIALYAGIIQANTYSIWKKINRNRVPKHYKIHRQYHRELVAALVSRDAERCRRISIEHLRGVRRRMFGD
jgi:DNA-binding FadR family transcriptional regulator